jgi:aryl-alcohol dehydrogenase-like predicted oxidoreductase
MQYRELGKTGINASVVAVGAWAIGGWMWGGQDDSVSIKTLQSSVDQGVNFIDTAPIYGFGHSEEVVGKAIAGRRDRVILATKCGLRWDGRGTRKGEFYFRSNEKGLEDSSNAPYEVYRFLGADSIREEVEASLRRLQVETIDLYQTHWQESTTAIEETMGALEKLRDEGKIRAIGVSNANVAQIQKYLGGGGVDADQEQYSMLDRKLESSNVPFCRKRKIAFLAYSPLANGLLSGKIGPDRDFGEGDLRSGHPRFSSENRSRVGGMLKELQPIAGDLKVSLAQLVIAWTIAQPGVTHALVGARSVEQATANAEAGNLTLSEEEISKIDRILAEHTPSIR